MRYWLFVAVLSLGGCVRSSAVPCGDGTVCAPGTTCDVAHGQCLSPDQYVSCVGQSDGELCPIGAAIGVCEDELCLSVTCGDGVVQGIEQCDGAPPDTTCFELGYDVGFLDCNESVCAANLAACQRIGWHAVAAPSSGSVIALAAAGGAGYAVRNGPGTNVILRLRSGVWAPLPGLGGTLVFSIYAASADDVWAGTEDGLLHLEGTTWVPYVPEINTVGRSVLAGAGPSDIYWFVRAPSAGARAFHFDGTQWTEIAAPPGAAVSASAGPTGVFVTDGTALRRWSGTTWDIVMQPLTTIDSITSFGTQLVLAGNVAMQAQVVIGDGTTWAQHDITRELGWQGGRVLVGGRTASELFAVEAGRAYLVRFDGAHWLRDAELPAGATALVAIGDQTYAGTTDGLARESPHAFVEVVDTFPAPAAGTGARFVWGRACDDVFVAVTGASTSDPAQIVHFDGTSWTVETEVPQTTFTSMTGSADGSTFATDYLGHLWTRSQSTWTREPAQFSTPPRSASLAPDGTLLVVGDYALHVREAGTWRDEDRPGEVFTSALAFARDDLYALHGRVLMHYDGTAWSSEELPGPEFPAALWGPSSGSLIVVGSNGHAWHRSNNTWRSEQMPFDNFLAVHGTSDTDVFAVGTGGTIAHFDGAHWSAVRDRLHGGGSVWSGGSCMYVTAGVPPSSVGRLRRSSAW